MPLRVEAFLFLIGEVTGGPFTRSFSRRGAGFVSSFGSVEIVIFFVREASRDPAIG